jgi:hypothetical protein
MPDDVSQDAMGANTSNNVIDTDILQDAVSISQFMQRPIRIATISWEIGEFLRETIDPWTLYITNPVIKRKLENYAYLRGTLKVKAMLNGNAFYYGIGMMSYNPVGFSYRDPDRGASAPAVDNVRFSQRLHVYLNPTESQGGELSLPFVFPTPFASRIANDDTSVDKLGRITFSSFNPLHHANAATDKVNITVLAYFGDDLELAGPTNFVSGAGKGDEYGQGVISKPASAIARMAGMLKTIPYIEPYATATQIGASAIAAIATKFGYSRPVNLEPVRKYRPTFMGNLANSEIEEATDKLTFDPKQELSIDPRLWGCDTGEDEMTIKHIASREAYIGRAIWDTQTPTDTLLYWSRVTPVQFTKSANSSAPGTEMHLTPLALSSLPFEWWRGSIIYRFQVACSNFHRGRLRLVYDPIGSTGGGATPPDFSSVYTRILDISESHEFEVKVGYNQQIAWRTIDPISFPQPPPFSPVIDVTGSSIVSPVFRSGGDNGALAIYVLNELTRPNDQDLGSPQINVFVRAGDDFEVAAPYEDALTSFSPFVSESGQMEVQEGMKKITLDPIGSSVDDNSLSLTYMGETFHSFRTMMKRYNYSRSFANVAVPTTREYALWRIFPTNFPLYRGADPEGKVYSKNTLMNWLTPCYVCRRGGIRWKYNYIYADGDASPVGRMMVDRRTSRSSAFTVEQLVQDIPRTSTMQSELTVRSLPTWEGAAVTQLATCPTLEVEIPYYSPHKFEVASKVGKSEEMLRHQLELTISNVAPDIPSHCVDAYCATGEDFTLSWFLNVPILYMQSDFPIV